MLDVPDAPFPCDQPACPPPRFPARATQTKCSTPPGGNDAADEPRHAGAVSAESGAVKSPAWPLQIRCCGVAAHGPRNTCCRVRSDG
jgi:hypothetical protein